MTAAMPGPARPARPFRLAIVGGGPRATYALERLSAMVGLLGGRPFEIRVFEQSGCFGDGQVHSAGQARTSHLNRIAAQVGFAADESTRAAGPLRPAEDRPTLHEWCRREHLRTGHPDFELAPDDWPKRYVHGLALRDMFAQYVADLQAEPGVSVKTEADEVVEVVPGAGALLLRTASGRTHPADHVLLVTGHMRADPLRGRQRALIPTTAGNGLTYVPHAYPLEMTLPAGVAGPGCTVAVAGMGLTAIDVILHLTEGRGGRFTGDPRNGLVYHPSGAEPASLIAFSSTGLFTFARALNQKTGEPPGSGGTFLNIPAVDRLRAGVARSGPRARPQLDFDRHLLPLVILEMATTHYATLFGPEVGHVLADACRPAYQEFCSSGPGADDPATAVLRLLAPLEEALDEITAAVRKVLAGQRIPDGPAGDRLRRTVSRWVEVVFDRRIEPRALDPVALAGVVAAWTSPWELDPDPEENRFDWWSTICPVPQGLSGEDYRRAVLDFMARDLRWAAQGNLDNPAKSAADWVWRDLRSVISYAVDDGGLTPFSHRHFLATHLRHHNRLANGAGLEVMARIRALVTHGLLDVTAGPDARLVLPAGAAGPVVIRGPRTGVELTADVLVEAHVPVFEPARDVSPLYRRMLAAGLVRLWQNVSEVDRFEPGGLDLTDRHHPIGRLGQVTDTVTVLGPAAEGRRSFLLSALRPGVDHYLMREVLCWIEDLWLQLERQAAVLALDPGTTDTVAHVVNHKEMVT